MEPAYWQVIVNVISRRTRRLATEGEGGCLVCLPCKNEIRLQDIIDQDAWDEMKDKLLASQAGWLEDHDIDYELSYLTFKEIKQFSIH